MSSAFKVHREGDVLEIRDKGVSMTIALSELAKSRLPDEFGECLLTLTLEEVKSSRKWSLKLGKPSES